MIIETDLGHDPDDLFAISYLVLKGVPISHVLITPGFQHQIQLARLIFNELGGDPVIVANKPSDKNGYGKMYDDLLTYCPTQDNKPDCYIYEIDKVPPSDLLVIGATKNCKALDCEWQNITIQGGFCPYSMYTPRQKLDKFLAINSCPSYNPNGDRKGFEYISNIECKTRRFVTKNVCHTVEINKDMLHQIQNNFVKQAFKFLFKYTNTKKMHDLIAAMTHIRPEVCEWTNGKVVKADSGWTTIYDDNDKVSVDWNKEVWQEELVKTF